jgi:hypothetical protein
VSLVGHALEQRKHARQPRCPRKRNCVPSSMCGPVQNTSGGFGAAQSLRLTYRSLFDTIGAILHAQQPGNASFALFGNCNCLCTWSCDWPLLQCTLNPVLMSVSHVAKATLAQHPATLLSRACQ